MQRQGGQRLKGQLSDTTLVAGPVTLTREAPRAENLSSPNRPSFYDTKLDIRKIRTIGVPPHIPNEQYHRDDPAPTFYGYSTNLFNPFLRQHDIAAPRSSDPRIMTGYDNVLFAEGNTNQLPASHLLLPSSHIPSKRATDRAGVEDHVDTMTTADSGYHSGTRNSCTNPGGEHVIDNDTDSVVTDVWPSSLLRQDRYMLEAEFAREMFNRSSVQTRERFAKRGETVMDLLYSFSVMIGGRASSAAERGAASFVRRGRKYVSRNPDPSRLSSHTRADFTGAY